MFRFVRRHILVVAMIAASPLSSSAAPIVIDFDALTEFDAVTTQFSGLTFANATVLTAGSSLNETENPPHSDFNVIYDGGGPISIAFATPISNFGGYFTYLLTSPARLTLSAFDSAHVALGSATQSAFSNNQGLSGGGQFTERISPAALQ